MKRWAGYLIVSDLHLSEGRDPKTGHVSRKEDFFFDEEFRHFLDHHMSAPEWSEVEWTLVINGDFMDFLQVTSVPPGECDLRVDPRFGLKAGPLESAWRLRRIFAGHHTVFRSLARFLLYHRVVIIAGNHDIEFVYPEVREALLECLAEAVALDHPGALAANLVFRNWFFLNGPIYVEHGQQYDRLNCFRNLLDPRLPDDPFIPPADRQDIDLPLGALFVRYMFNEIETSSPFADNIKPTGRFLTWFLLNRPLEAMRFLFSDGREMMRRLKRKWRPVPPEAYQERDARQMREMERLGEELAEQLPLRDSNQWKEVLREIDRLKATSILRELRSFRWRFLRRLVGPLRTPILLWLPLLMVAAGGILAVLPLLAVLLPSPLAIGPRWLFAIAPVPLLEMVRWLLLGLVTALVLMLVRSRRAPRTKEILRARAADLRRLTGARFIVMGHTHDSDLWPLGDGAVYFNSGTWTKVFSHEERIIREEKELTFVRILAKPSGLRGKLMKWEAAGTSARLAYVFDEIDRPPAFFD
jgi:UDP-2,3-diacylglucosamine pyrophosphatase LpxH